jgi:hypothetical protein
MKLNLLSLVYLNLKTTDNNTFQAIAVQDYKFVINGPVISWDRTLLVTGTITLLNTI